MRVSSGENERKMSSYTGTSNRPDRAKAIAAVVAVHAGFAAVILTGLNVRMVSAVVDRLQTFDIQVPPPPPPEPPPPPAKKAQKAKLDEGAAGKKAEPTPVVAPKPKLLVQSPIPAAPVAGQGTAPRSGAATSGTGTGAGGSGNGPGGGGYGDFSGYTPAQIIRKIPNREYRRISAGRIPQGSTSIRFRVEPDGRMSNCRIIRTSGDAYVDSIVCDAATRNMRFSPARDASGRPIPYEMSYTPTWSPKSW